jgi:hypothetical protein
MLWQSFIFIVTIIYVYWDLHQLNFINSACMQVSSVIFSAVDLVLYTTRTHQTKSRLPQYASVSFSIQVSLDECVWFQYCHVSRVSVTYKTGFWMWWSNLLNIYATGYNSSQITDTLSSSSDWTLQETILISYLSPPLLRCTPSILISHVVL